MLLITDKIFISFPLLIKVEQNPFNIGLAPPLLKVDYIVLLHFIHFWKSGAKPLLYIFGSTFIKGGLYRFHFFTK